MAISIDPEFTAELSAHVEHPFHLCFNCGTCAAVCPLIHEHFPRRMIRYAQIGARDAIIENAPELWRCLHCGMCNQNCPRDALPGELMLGLRRFALTARHRRSAHV